MSNVIFQARPEPTRDVGKSGRGDGGIPGPDRRRVEPIVYESLGDRVYKAVRELIIGRLISPGSKLNVEELCRDLKVSRTPVWDAIKRLQAEGLLETVPRRGVFVQNYNAESIQDVFAVREVLDGLAARLASERLTAAGEENLRSVIETLREAVGAGDVEACARAALRFHNEIVSTAGNPMLSRLLENVYAHTLVFRLWSLYDREHLDRSLSEHSQLLHALLARDPERADSFARAHVRRVLADLIQGLKTGTKQTVERSS